MPHSGHGHRLRQLHQQLSPQRAVAAALTPPPPEPAADRLNEYPLSAIDLTVSTVQRHLQEHGHLLIRGAFDATASGLAALQSVALAGLEPMSYVGGANDRQEQDGVFDAGSEPAHLDLAFHNEMAYLRHAVRVIAFGCIVPAANAAAGAGRTTIADNRAALRLLPAVMSRRLAVEGVLYEQRLSNGAAPSDGPVYKTWQQAFDATSSVNTTNFVFKTRKFVSKTRNCV